MNGKIIYVDFTKSKFKRKFTAFIKNIIKPRRNSLHSSRKKTSITSGMSSKKRIIPY